MPQLVGCDAAGNATFFTNGTKSTTTLTLSLTLTGNLITLASAIGATGTIGTFHEAVIYKGKLSDANMQLLQTFLGAGVGVTL